MDTNTDKQTRNAAEQRHYLMARLPGKAGYGNNEKQRNAYLLAQQALRRLADRGYTLETDPDGVAQMRVPSFATTVPTTLDALASAWPARRIADSGELGAIVRSWRERLGISRTTACDGAEVSPSFLRSTECGKSTVQFGKVLDVLEILGLELVIRVRRTSPQKPLVLATRPSKTSA